MGKGSDDIALHATKIHFVVGLLLPLPMSLPLPLLQTDMEREKDLMTLRCTLQKSTL